MVKSVIHASADQVAIDAVAARLTGFGWLAIPYIHLAHERGLAARWRRETAWRRLFRDLPAASSAAAHLLPWQPRAPRNLKEA